MPSQFETDMGYGLDALLRPMALSVAVHYVDGTSETVSAIYNEQVGFIDDNGRAVFTLKRDDLAQALKRVDYFLIDGESVRWNVTDVRDDKSGGLEVRCDQKLDRT